MTTFYVLFGLLVVMPWAAVIIDLPLVRHWWLVRRARRTTRRILERSPEALRPPSQEERPTNLR